MCYTYYNITTLNYPYFFTEVPFKLFVMIQRNCIDTGIIELTSFFFVIAEVLQHRNK